LIKEPEEKKIDVSKLLREFFTRHFLAQHMSLAILSNGMYVVIRWQVVIDSVPLI